MAHAHFPPSCSRLVDRRRRPVGRHARRVRRRRRHRQHQLHRRRGCPPPRRRPPPPRRGRRDRGRPSHHRGRSTSVATGRPRHRRAAATAGAATEAPASEHRRRSTRLAAGTEPCAPAPKPPPPPTGGDHRSSAPAATPSGTVPASSIGTTESSAPGSSLPSEVCADSEALRDSLAQLRGFDITTPARHRPPRLPRRYQRQPGRPCAPRVAPPSQPSINDLKTSIDDLSTAIDERRAARHHHRGQRRDLLGPVAARPDHRRPVPDRLVEHPRRHHPDLHLLTHPRTPKISTSNFERFCTISRTGIRDRTYR